jgi:hypothetical protein
VPTHQGYILRILGEAKEPLFARQIERLNSEPPVTVLRNATLAANRTLEGSG